MSKVKDSLRRPCAAGFTLIEMLTVIVIVAVLTGLALANFSDTVLRWRVRSAAEELIATLYYARNESIRRGGGVIVGRLDADSQCPLLGGRGDWSCGWRVYRPANAPEWPELLQNTRLPAGLALKQTSSLATLTMDGWGQLNGAGMAGFVLSAQGRSDPRLSAVVCVSSGGRIRMKMGVTSCSAA
ncbi:MAG: GspH/FimT family pseudopilin [Burkholderiaceae bacterium]|jgi:type IV fimbrial biogenesis protein FimT|nr:GspH/FimT family pseudopilin [Burkholderiaceae bacterium]